MWVCEFVSVSVAQYQAGKLQGDTRTTKVGRTMKVGRPSIIVPTLLSLSVRILQCIRYLVRELSWIYGIFYLHLIITGGKNILMKKWSRGFPQLNAILFFCTDSFTELSSIHPQAVLMIIQKPSTLTCKEGWWGCHKTFISSRFHLKLPGRDNTWMEDLRYMYMW